MSKEYIERGALIAEMQENINTYWNGGHGGYYLAEDALNESVKTAPTADVVEVVRCGNCKHKNEWIRNGLGEYFCRRSGLWCLTDNHFCSYGERKDK